MRTLRAVTAGALALTIVGAGATIGGASAATTTGVGTAKTSTSVLDVQLGGGKLLGLRVVGEDSQSTTDKKTGATSAFTRLVPLTLSSQAVQALNTSLAAIEARAPGGSNNVPAVSVPLSTPASSGNLTLASLTAAVDASGAKSALSSSLDNLAVAGGLVTAPKVSSTLGTEAVATNADGVRGIKADQITVLDLGALLDGLGLKLTDLPISVVSDLLTKLGLGVPGVDAGSLQGAVDTLNGAITQVNALITQINNAGGTLPSDVTNTVGGIVGTVDNVLTPVTGASLQGRRLQAITIPTIPSVITTVDQVTQILDTLNQNLVDVLGNALGALDAAPLLQLKGIDVGLTTKAADTVANSVATVTAKIGDVVVGGNVVPGVDLGATATQLTNLVNTVTGQIGSALGAVDPGLAKLVSVKLFDQSKSVTAANGYTTAVAKLSALTATITPPADLGAIVTKVEGLTGIGDVLATLGVRLPAALPVLSDAMAQLEGALGGTVQALSQGATVSVASLSSTSEFAPAPAAVTTPGAPAGSATGELPRTGGDNATYAVLGVLLLALAAAIVRWLRRPVNAL